jgi:hypothetical protein
MMYKLKNNIVRIDASSKLIPNERPSRNNTEQALRIPSCKTTTRKDSFYHRTIKKWNTLPNCAVSAEPAYSRVGLTRDTYAFSLIDLLEMFKFLLRKLMVLLALEQMVLICLPHLRSDEMVHPRYFADGMGPIPTK